ncbi:MAG: Uma2 family endonuclease [Myxococcales bacterium]|nr:Uma2 family endonuclease [Myxococcales bacterium]
MAEAARSLFTFREYLEVEAASPIRHEFLDGVVYAMAGGSPEHAGIAANLIRLLGNALETRPCRVFTADLRIRCLESGLATYPDLSVVCGRVQLDPEDARGHTAVNPVLLVEVLSPSTEAYDRGDKLAHYKRIPSVREVALVAHDDRRVDLWRRTTSGWTQLVFREGDSVELESVGCSVAVLDVYFDPLSG